MANHECVSRPIKKNSYDQVAYALLSRRQEYTSGEEGRVQLTLRSGMNCVWGCRLEFDCNPKGEELVHVPRSVVVGLTNQVKSNQIKSVVAK